MFATYGASRRMVASLIPLLFGTVSVSVMGQCLSNEFVKLMALDAVQSGNAVAMTDNVLLIQATAFNPDGSVYVYRFDTSRGAWLQEAQLSGSDTVAGDGYGASVAVAGDIIVVGAPLNDDDGGNSGSAYVYRLEGDEWIEEQKLTASDATTNDWFGISVSIDGESIAVGAFQRFPLGTRPGAAYVYTYDSKASTWNEEAELAASDGTDGDEFGISISISGNTVVVGAYEDDDAGTGSGSAYVFRRKEMNWVEEEKLNASDGGTGQSFGGAVATTGNTVLVGSTGAFDNGVNTGAGYIFGFEAGSGKWIEEQKLLAHDGASDHRFGGSVSLRNQLALLGALRDDDGGDQSGSAYLFQFDGLRWVEEAKLTASDDDPFDHFGRCVAIGTGALVVGAYHDDEAGDQAGAAYLFGGLGDCNTNGELDLCDIADGQSNDVNDNGIPDDCECIWDLDDNGSVGASDLLTLLASWGPCKGCDADFDGNGTVGASDLLALLANWGPCP